MSLTVYAPSLIYSIIRLSFFPLLPWAARNDQTFWPATETTHSTFYHTTHNIPVFLLLLLLQYMMV